MKTKTTLQIKSHKSIQLEMPLVLSDSKSDTFLTDSGSYLFILFTCFDIDTEK